MKKGNASTLMMKMRARKPRKKNLIQIFLLLIRKNQIPFLIVELDLHCNNQRALKDFPILIMWLVRIIRIRKDSHLVAIEIILLAALRKFAIEVREAREGKFEITVRQKHTDLSFLNIL